MRYGAAHAVKHFRSLAREILPNGGKINKKYYHWLAQLTGGQKYITKISRDICQAATDTATLVRFVQGLVQHMKGHHDNDFCKKQYKNCQSPEYRQTWKSSSNEKEDKVVDAWAETYGLSGLLKVLAGG